MKLIGSTLSLYLLNDCSAFALSAVQAIPLQRASSPDSHIIQPMHPLNSTKPAKFGYVKSHCDLYQSTTAILDAVMSTNSPDLLYSVLPPTGSISQDDDFPDVLAKLFNFDTTNHGILGIEQVPIDEAIQDMQHDGASLVTGWTEYRTINGDVTLEFIPTVTRLLKRSDCEAAARILKRFIDEYEFITLSMQIINIHEFDGVGLGRLKITRH